MYIYIYTVICKEHFTGQLRYLTVLRPFRVVVLVESTCKVPDLKRCLQVANTDNKIEIYFVKENQRISCFHRDQVRGSVIVNWYNVGDSPKHTYP